MRQRQKKIAILHITENVADTTTGTSDRQDAAAKNRARFRTPTDERRSRKL